MKYLLALMISFSAIGCSTVERKVLDDQPLNQSITDEFDVYMRLFSANAMLYSELPIDYVKMKQGLKIYMSDNMSDNILGLCSFPEDNMDIYINERAWNNMTSLQREMVLFHELGHCYLRLKHDARTTRKGTPKSIMHPFDQDSSAYIEYYRYYNKQLFDMFWRKLKKQKPRDFKNLKERTYMLKKTYFKKGK